MQIAEESPDSTGNGTSEREDVRESMITEKKTTALFIQGKGEKVV